MAIVIKNCKCWVVKSEMVKDNLSISEMKKIAHDIIDDECVVNGLDMKVFPVTFVEYYNEYLSDKTFRLFKAVEYVRSKAFNDLNGNLVLFLERINKVKGIGRQTFKLVQICYHEVYHSIQKKLDPYSYEGIINSLDLYLRNKDEIDYSLFHNKYFFEIGANMYSISKARKYMIKHYPQLYESEKEEIDRLEKKYSYDYLTYDLVEAIEKVIELRKKRYNSYSSMIHVPMVYDMYMSEDYPEVMSIFMNYNCTFRSVKDIISDKRFNNLDKRVVSAFLSCKYFLESVDMDSLSYEELIVVTDALMYTDEVYQKQVKIAEKSYKEKFVTFIDYLNLQKYLINKMNNIKKFLDKPKLISSVKRG